MPRFLDHCIFCPNTNLSQTHIWPEWLNKLLQPGSNHLEELENPHDSSIQRSTPKLGSIFRKKPYLACVDCNTGWMEKFENEMLKFAKPIFTSLETEIPLDKTTQRILAVWLSLITVLAEYIDHKSSVCISTDERIFLKRHLMPPENWTIVACSQKSASWYAKYRHHSSFVGDFGSRAEYFAAVARGQPNNCQFSSFGMGNFFAQVFSCPNQRLIEDYRIATRRAGFNQLWPVPRGFWPLTKGFSKFPTETILGDNEAASMADAFSERLKRMTQPPYFGGQNAPEL